MKFNPEKTVFLIDGSSFLYRAYYGLRPLHTPKGEPVQAVYSFCRMIKKLIKTFSPSYIALVWDSKGPTVRHAMYPEYKATRQAPPSDLFEQKKYIVQFAEMIGLAQIAQQGIEADDIMYSLAVERRQQGDHAVFITSDKDMSQALDAQTSMYDPFKDEFITPETFQEKMGFAYTKLPFYFALLGDASDNIPGVKGIGKKGALDLVTQFDSLQDMYDHLENVAKPRIRQLLEEQRENAFLSEKLFLLQYHPTHLTKENVHFDAHNWAKARPLFVELHFLSLLQELSKEEVISHQPGHSAKRLQKYTFTAVTTEKDLDDLCTLIKEKKVCAVDTETDGLDPLQCTLVGASFCVQEGTAYYVPIAHVAQQDVPSQVVIQKIKPVLEDPHIRKYFHNSKFDEKVFWTAGIKVRGVVFDTMVASSLVIKEWQRSSLKELSLQYFDEPMLTFQEVVKANKYKDFSYVPLELATEYAAADAHQTFKLHAVLVAELEEQNMLQVYEQLEEPLTHVLLEMELEGIFLDRQVLAAFDAQVAHKLDQIEKDILLLLGEKYENLNLNSPKQIEQLLFYDLGLPPKKKSAKGAYSTDQEVLEELAKDHVIPGLILKYRELFKLKSTYIDALPTYINPTTHKIHTTFNQITTATGRLASYDPNLQNIPAGGYGLAIREAFKPDQGCLFLAADYSQIELRVLAHLSGDENLIASFMSGLDIHAQTAARLFEVPLTAVTSEQRQLGKRINFSILYGLTPYGLSQDLKIPFKDAKLYIEKYFQQYPKVSQWMEQVVQQAKNNGYVTTHWGRKRYIPAIYEKNKALFQEASRIAINTVAQGTAAEIMKFGMIQLDAAIKKLI